MSGAAGSCVLRLRLVGHHGFGGDQQRSNRGGVLQRRADNLGRVDDAGLHHVGEGAGGGIIAFVGVLALEKLADDDRTLGTGILGNVAGRGLQGAAHDLDADLLVTVRGLQLVEDRRST